MEKINILEISGDVWLHRENTSSLIADNHHNLNYGDLLIVYPGGQINLELSSDKFIHLGSEDKEALLIDHSVLDQNYDFNEVFVDTSNLTNFLVNFSPEWMIADNTDYALLTNQHDFNFTNPYEEAPILSFNEFSNQDESYSASKIKLFDVISNFDPINDFFTLPPSSSILKGSNEVMFAQNKVNLDIASHKIDSQGYIIFKDSQGGDISLKNATLLDDVVDYLQKNLNANEGDTIIFKVANDSYLMHFHPEIYKEGFGLTKFEGLSFEGMSDIHDGLNGNYLYVDFV